MRTAIVTGHSRGLGAAIAAGLLARDIPVLGISRGANGELAKRFGDTLTQAQVDLSDAQALTRWLETHALRDFLASATSVVLVNNAGLLQPVGPLERQDPTAVSKTIAVNVGAALALSAAFVAATADAEDRRILHISSGAARKAYAGWSVYCATKAALDHHARAVDMDRTPRLRICSLAPGVIDTDMQAEVRESAVELFPDRERFITMKREGRLKNVDATGRDVVAFLLSDGFGQDVVAELPR